MSQAAASLRLVRLPATRHSVPAALRGPLLRAIAYSAAPHRRHSFSSPAPPRKPTHTAAAAAASAAQATMTQVRPPRLRLS